MSLSQTDRQQKGEKDGEREREREREREEDGEGKKLNKSFPSSSSTDAATIFEGRTWIVGKGRLYSQTSFIYENEMLRCFIKGVSGGCFVLINK